MRAPKNQKPNDLHSPAETQRRFEAALKGARNVGHKTYEESKVGRRTNEPAAIPAFHGSPAQAPPPGARATNKRGTR
jgi:hypothetical protein